MPLTIDYQSPCVLVLAGPTGAGKSAFARRTMPDINVVSSDAMRQLIADNPADQSVTTAAFELVHEVARRRLAAGRAAVIDSTALLPRDRAPLVELARKAGVACHLLVLTATEQECLAAQRAPDRMVRAPERAVRRHLARQQQLLADIRFGRINTEGFTSVRVFDRKAAAEVEAVRFVACTAEAVDVIGDVHGCLAELEALLGELGYEPHPEDGYRHPDGRVAVFVGDLADRGPRSLDCLMLAHRMVRAGTAVIGAIGNHDWKLYRAVVRGADVKHTHGFDRTAAEIESARAADPRSDERIRQVVRELFERAPSHSVLCAGELVVTHGAIPADLVGTSTDYTRRDEAATLGMYGQTAGTDPATGYPIRVYRWAETHTDPDRLVVFGHDVLGPKPMFVNAQRTVVGIDTGCVFGGALSALRFPEREIVQVFSSRAWGRHDRLTGLQPRPLKVDRFSLAEVGDTGSCCTKEQLRRPGSRQRSDDHQPETQHEIEDVCGVRCR